MKRTKSPDPFECSNLQFNSTNNIGSRFKWNDATSMKFTPDPDGRYNLQAMNSIWDQISSGGPGGGISAVRSISTTTTSLSLWSDRIAFCYIRTVNGTLLRILHTSSF